MRVGTHGKLSNVVHLVRGTVGSRDGAAEQHLHHHIEHVAPLEAAVISNALWSREGGVLSDLAMTLP